LQRLLTERGAVGGVKAFVEVWRQKLISSDFKGGGCPILAAAVEDYVAEKSDALAALSTRCRAILAGHGLRGIYVIGEVEWVLKAVLPEGKASR
jgi:hypothetical protein